MNAKRFYIAAVLLSSASLTISGQNPPTSQAYDDARTYARRSGGPVTPSVRWVYDFPGLLTDNTPPLVGPDGSVYVNGSALRPDGTLKWNANPSAAHSTSAISRDGGVIYGFNVTGSLVALAASNGSLLWQSPIAYALNSASITVSASDTVYLVSSPDSGAPHAKGAIHAYDANGTLRWATEVETCGAEAPIAVDPNDNVFLSTKCSGLVAFAPDGSIRWSAPALGGHSGPRPNIGPDGIIYLGKYSGGLSAYKPNGSVKWRRQSLPGNACCEAVPGVTLSADGSSIYTAALDGTIESVAAETGALIYSRSYQRADGQPFRFDSATALSSNGVLYVRDDDDKLLAISAADGNVIWQFQLNTGASNLGPAPPALGPDGTLYVLANGDGNHPSARLYAFHDDPSVPILQVALSHKGSFEKGQIVTYTAAVSNWPTAQPTSGTVTLTEMLPAGLTLISMQGPGWTCDANSCSRNDSIAGGASYPPVTIMATVELSLPEPASLKNRVTLTAWGALGASAGDWTDIVSGANLSTVQTDRRSFEPRAAGRQDLSVRQTTSITTASTAVLSIHKSHTGNFTRGQIGATYTVTVSNAANAATSSGTVTVTEAAPAGLTLVSMSGTGWTCPNGGITCTRGDGLAAGASYPAITVTVNVTANSTSPQVNTVTVAGGGSLGATARDSTVIAPPAASVALGFYPVSPCRLADTRASQGKTGAFGPPSLGSYASRGFPVGGNCGVSNTALAYSLNLTAVPPGRLDFLSMWPAGQAYPGVSTLNSSDGSTLANAALVSAGSAGSVTALAANPTDLIIDVNGYFAPPSPSGMAFYPVTPCRVIDTRQGQGKAGLFGPPNLVGYASRDFPIAGYCGIPVSAQAYALNVTAAPAGPLGFLSLWPTGQSYPGVSTLNSPDGGLIANAAIVPAGSAGKVTAVSSNPTNLIVDVNGYFGPPGGVGALNFYAMTPCRVADTRQGQGKTGAFGPPSLGTYASRDFPIVSSSCGVPASARAYSLNVTALPSGPLSFLSIWPAGQPYPGVSTLNSPKGTVMANAALIVAGANGAVTVVSSDPTDLIIDINGYFAP